MEENKQFDKPKPNPLRALEAQIKEAKSVKDLMKIGTVSDRYIKTFEAITGRQDGIHVYEREVYSFIERVMANPAIQKCNPFSIISGFIKASTFGNLSLQGNDIYLIPRGTQLSVEASAHGKKRMIKNMPKVKDVEEPVLIFDKDPFTYDSKKKVVISHTQAWPRPEATDKTVIGCYCTIQYKNGTTRDVLIDIHEIKKARSASKMTDGGDLWSKYFGEAVKKTAYNRAFKVLYERPDIAAEFKQYEAPDTEDIIDQDTQEVSEAEMASMAVEQETVENKEEFNASVNEETGEVYEPTEEVKSQPKPSKPKPKSFI